MSQLRKLGRSDIAVTPIGLGCWQFSEGRGLGGRFWPVLAPDTVNKIVAASLAGGVNWFDTAELYGDGRSEAALSRALTRAGKKNGEVVIATKWSPLFRTAANIRTTIGERIKQLSPFAIDLYQIHQPIAFASTEAQMNAMADLVARKSIRTVGVSNFSAAKMRAAHKALAARGIPLVSNQVLYHLLQRGIESNGILDTAKELGITIIAYSPLASGILTGKFHKDPNLVRAIKGPRKWMPGFGARALERSRPLIAALDEIGAAHGASAAQVALNWLVNFHGDTVVAIPGASSVGQAESNARTMTFQLSDSELHRIDALSRR